jgi:hypothetical protein
MPRGPSRSGAVEADRGVDTILLDGDRVRGARHCACGGADEREEFSPMIFGDAATTVLADMASEETRNRFATPYRSRLDKAPLPVPDQAQRRDPWLKTLLVQCAWAYSRIERKNPMGKTCCYFDQQQVGRSYLARNYEEALMSPATARGSAARQRSRA